MKPYTVTRPVNYGKAAAEARLYQAGEPIELDDDTAKPLLECGAIVERDPKAQFQDAVAKAHAAARELEEAGGDPSAAARELQQRAQDEERVLDAAIDAVAKVVSTGLLTAGDAASQLCEQLKRTDHEAVLDRIVARVNAMNHEPKEKVAPPGAASAGDSAAGSNDAGSPGPAARESRRKK